MLLLKNRLREHLPGVTLRCHANEDIDNLVPLEPSRVSLCETGSCLALQLFYLPIHPKCAIHPNQKALSLLESPLIFTIQKVPTRPPLILLCHNPRNRQRRLVTCSLQRRELAFSKNKVAFPKTQQPSGFIFRCSRSFL